MAEFEQNALPPLGFVIGGKPMTRSPMVLKALHPTGVSFVRTAEFQAALG
jgi:hypothetical protein